MDTQRRTDILFALAGDVRRNSRALRQIRALAGHGWIVRVLSFGSSDDSLAVPGWRVDLIPEPNLRGAGYFLAVHRAFARIARTVPARVFHAGDLYVLPALSAAAAEFRGKLLYDARELYPYVASTVRRPWVRYFWKKVEGRYIRKADAVLTVSDGIGRKLKETYGIADPIVIHNVPERQEVTSSCRLRTRAGIDSNTIVVLHQGQLRPHRGCELLVDAMREVDGAVLVFLGDGPLRDALQARTARHGIASRVRFLDPVPPEELLSHTACADLGVTLLEDVCLNHRYALPNKLFEYLGAGIPVIAADLHEIRGIVKTYDVGMLVDTSGPGDLAAALQRAVLDKQLRESWRRNIPLLHETFSWENASERFLDVVDHLFGNT